MTREKEEDFLSDHRWTKVWHRWLVLLSTECEKLSRRMPVILE